MVLSSFFFGGGENLICYPTDSQIMKFKRQTKNTQISADEMHSQIYLVFQVKTGGLQSFSDMLNI